MEELISVIVPIYNVEKYLDKCLQSIINQTYKNLEIILVDDGSLDDCPQLCEEYAKRDKRIKVVHQKNGGLSTARNKGLSLAKGNYIAFVDSDDTIHQQMYEYLYETLKSHEADMSICDYNVTYEGSEIENNNIDKIERNTSVYHGTEIFDNLYGSLAGVTVVAWNKLYRKELFKNIHYMEGKIHEDEFIIHRILDKAKTVVYLNLPLYNYLQRDSSIMGRNFNVGRLDALEALEDRMEFFRHKGYTELYSKTIDCYLNLLITCYYSAKTYINNNSYTFLREKFLDFYREMDKNIVLTRKTILKCKLFYMSPLLYELLLEFVHIIRGYRKGKNQ